MKPQDKHLQTRAEYLIKLLQQASLENKADELRKVSHMEQDPFHTKFCPSAEEARRTSKVLFTNLTFFVLYPVFPEAKNQDQEAKT